MVTCPSLLRSSRVLLGAALLTGVVTAFLIGAASAPAASSHRAAKVQRHTAKRCRHGRRVRRRSGKAKHTRWVCATTKPHHAKRARRRRGVTATVSRAKNPAQIPAQIPTPAPGVSPLIWNGDVSTGNLSQYPAPQSCQNALGMISAVPNPHPDSNFSGPYAMSFAVSDQAVHANCPVLGSPGHPNANMVVANQRLLADSDFYIGLSVYLPANFPPHICWDDSGAWIYSCWMQLMEVYGAPYGGASPINLSVLGATAAPHTNQIIFNAPNGGVAAGSPGAIWRSPPLGGTGQAWQDFVIHIHLSRCGGTTACSGGEAPGFVELWYNGVAQHFYDGSTRAQYATLTQANYCAPGTRANCGYDTLDLQQYRGNEPSYTDGSTGGAGTYSPTYPGLGTVSYSLGGARIGTTYAAVAPH